MQSLLTLHNVEILHAEKNSDSSYYRIATLNQGWILAKKLPLAKGKLFVHSLQLNKWGGGIPTIITDEVTRKPLTTDSLVILKEESQLPIDIKMLIDLGLFHGSVDPLEKLLTLPEYSPFLDIFKTSSHALIYLFLDKLHPLSKVIDPKVLTELEPLQLLRVCEIAKTNPSLFRFKGVIPYKKRFPELNSEEIQLLWNELEWKPSTDEQIAVSIYERMKNDLNFGHTVTSVRSVFKNVPFADKGINWLISNNIIVCISNQYLSFKAVLAEEEMIRWSLRTLEERIKDPEKKMKKKFRTKEEEEAATVARGFNLDEHQINAIKSVYNKPAGIISGKAGSGKCLAPDTPVLMYDGTVKSVKEVINGDLLMGDDSTPRTVTGTCSGRDQMYRITTTDGDSFVCNGPHLLTLYFPASVSCNDTNELYVNSNSIPEKRIGSTSQDAFDFMSDVAIDIVDMSVTDFLTKDEKTKQRAFMVLASVEFSNTVDLPQDPYMVGVMAAKQDSSIPKEYKIASRCQRLSLLAGILEQIGTTSDKGITVICNKSLSTDIMFIARTLGIRVSNNKKFHFVPNTEEITLYVYSNSPKCKLSSTDYIFELKSMMKRKKTCLVPVSFTVEPINNSDDCNREYCGFELDANGRFLLGNCIVTHNTSIQSTIVEHCIAGTILGCAPTNKAARVLAKKASLETCTIHKLIKQLLKGVMDYQKVRALIIDEASMVPLSLCAALLFIAICKCPNLSSVILVGDVNQLMSIGYGNLLHDMKQIIPCSMLNTCYRVTEGAFLIYENSNKILKKDFNLTFDTSNFILLPCTPDRYTDIAKAISLTESNPWTTHIITPKRNIAKDINKEARFIFTRKGDTFGTLRQGDKIVCYRNNPEAGVVNGDFFLLCRVIIVANEKDQVVSEVPDTSQILKNNQRYLLEVSYAPTTQEEYQEMQSQPRFTIDTNIVPLRFFAAGYCTTNHKFQGCETENIIFYLPEPYTWVHQRDIYTAITRAKSKVIIISNLPILQKIISSREIPRRTMFTQHVSQNKPLLQLDIIHDKEQLRLMGLDYIDVGDDIESNDL